MRKASEKTLNDPARVLLTPEELAGRYAVAKSTVLEWWHQGKIPAEVAVGKVIRFDADKVAKALAKDAKNGRRPEKLAEENAMGKVMVV